METDLTLVADDDLVVHRVRDVVDVELDGRFLVRPHETGACPCDGIAWHHLPDYYLGRLNTGRNR